MGDTIGAGTTPTNAGVLASTSAGATGTIGITANASITGTTFGINVTATGGGAITSSNLIGAARSDGVTYSVLGLRVIPGSFTLGDDFTLAPKVDAGWQHAFNTFLPQQSEGFVSTGTAFTVLGAPLDNDALVSSLGLDLGLPGGGDVLLSYDGLMSDRVQSSTDKAQLSWPL